MFSRRIPRDLRPTAWARALEDAGDVPFDLTGSNPTACGIPYPGGMLEPLADPGGLVYRPDPLGLPAARETVADRYRARGLAVDPDRVLLTCSSSEAYALLFKLLADPGDEVLVPAPSYPLFEHLATLEGLVARTYRLDPQAAWQPDPDDLRRGSPRAILAVHPNNPTGSWLGPAARRDLIAACAATGAALIVDEVFSDYPLGDAPPAPTFADVAEVPTFTLGGLSKSVALPQLKLSWTVLSGPADAVGEARERLSFVADQYLSAATPVQLALPRLLETGATVREAVLARCRGNLRALREALAAAPAASLVEPAAGWSAVVRFPATIPEEDLALGLLREDGVAVQPGWLFDFPSDGYLVVGLLAEPAAFAEGVRRLARRLARASGA